MIHLKSKDELRVMRESGLIAAGILDEVCEAAKPGVSTWDLELIARRGIEKHKVRSAFLRYNPGGKPPYPAVLCVSRNEIIVHGIPSKHDVLLDGDIIGIDFGIFHQGFCADNARTVMVGAVSPEKRRLVETCRDSLEAAIRLCVAGNRIGDLGDAIQNYAESRGYSVVEQFVGHGIGRAMHEEPQVPNYIRDNKRGKRMKTGLVIAVEPMVNAGTPDVEELDDEWTAVTKDRSMSAHFEHTIAITDEGPWVLTRANSSPGNPGSPS
ncbi:MAG TPA: type I methionyl aminopeptidase [Kofleriaceae bacterium]